jgi:ankyrin repeat protein
LKAGADINTRRENGGTPLHDAARSNSNPEVISVLLKARADANARDKYGKRPIDYAKADNEAIKNTDAYWQLNDATTY